MILQQPEITSSLDDQADPVVCRVEDTPVRTSASAVAGSVGGSTPNTKVPTNVATSQVATDGFTTVVSKQTRQRITKQQIKARNSAG